MIASNDLESRAIVQGIFCKSDLAFFGSREPPIAGGATAVRAGLGKIIEVWDSRKSEFRKLKFIFVVPLPVFILIIRFILFVDL